MVCSTGVLLITNVVVADIDASIDNKIMKYKVVQKTKAGNNNQEKIIIRYRETQV